MTPSRRAPVRCLVVLAALSLTGCSWIMRGDKPTPNLSATRVGTSVPRTPAPTERPASPSGSTSTRRSATPTTTSATPLNGNAPDLAADGWGPVRFNAPATAGPGVVWQASCQSWVLQSSGGTRVGEAQTTTGAPDAPIFAIRIDHPGIKGPGGLALGATEGTVHQVLPDARTGTTETSTWLWQESGASQFVTQLDRESKTVVAMLVLPAGKGAQSFPTRASC